MTCDAVHVDSVCTLEILEEVVRFSQAGIASKRLLLLTLPCKPHTQVASTR